MPDRDAEKGERGRLVGEREKDGYGQKQRRDPDRDLQGGDGGDQEGAARERRRLATQRWRAWTSAKARTA